MARMDAFNLKRLKEEQEKALIQTDNQLEQWNKFQSDFVALRDWLKTLPNKMTHNVMVPFGSLAFMPGQLVHTNEIMVLLGDNYFVERSATQAVDIVTRRMKKLDENIQALQKQREMLTPRAQFTSEMIQMAAGEGEMQEIVEEYDEERERQWRERRREYLRQAGEKQMKENAEKKRQAAMEKTDEDYWDILDRLEEQENEREELENLEEEYDQWETEQEQSQTTCDSDRYAEDEEDSSDDDDDDETEEEEEEEESADDEEEEDVDPSQQKITFSHTKQDSSSPSQESAAEEEDNVGIINSPADLYRIMKMPPKSILKTPSKDSARQRPRVGHTSQGVMEKKVTFPEKEPEERNVCGVKTCPSDTSVGGGFAVGETVQPRSDKPLFQICSRAVVERPTPAMCVKQPGNSSTASGSGLKPKEVLTSSHLTSKFRAAQQTVDISPLASSELLSQDPMGPGVSSASRQGLGVSSSARPVSKFRASHMKQGGGS